MMGGGGGGGGWVGHSFFPPRLHTPCLPAACYLPCLPHILCPACRRLCLFTLSFLYQFCLFLLFFRLPLPCYLSVDRNKQAAGIPCLFLCHQSLHRLLSLLPGITFLLLPCLILGATCALHSPGYIESYCLPRLLFWCCSAFLQVKMDVYLQTFLAFLFFHYLPCGMFLLRCRELPRHRMPGHLPLLRRRATYARALLCAATSYRARPCMVDDATLYYCFAVTWRFLLLCVRFTLFPFCCSYLLVRDTLVLGSMASPFSMPFLCILPAEGDAPLPNDARPVAPLDLSVTAGILPSATVWRTCRAAGRVPC